MELPSTCQTCRLHKRCKGLLKNNCVRYKSKQRETEETFWRRTQIDMMRKHYNPNSHARIRGEQ